MRLRISLAGMMGLLLALGLGLSTLRFPSEGAAAAVLLVTQALLAFAVLAVVYRTRERRAFWLGFALFGWGYMALTSDSWWGRGADRPETLTSMILDQWEYSVRRTPGRHTFFLSLIRPVGDDARSQRILAMLEEPVSMSFASEMPLEDVLKKPEGDGPSWRRVGVVGPTRKILAARSSWQVASRHRFAYHRNEPQLRDREKAMARRELCREPNGNAPPDVP